MTAVWREVARSAAAHHVDEHEVDDEEGHDLHAQSSQSRYQAPDVTEVIGGNYDDDF